MVYLFGRKLDSYTSMAAIPEQWWEEKREYESFVPIVSSNDQSGYIEILVGDSTFRVPVFREGTSLPIGGSGGFDVLSRVFYQSPTLQPVVSPNSICYDTGSGDDMSAYIIQLTPEDFNIAEGLYYISLRYKYIIAGTPNRVTIRVNEGGTQLITELRVPPSGSGTYEGIFSFLFEVPTGTTRTIVTNMRIYGTGVSTSTTAATTDEQFIRFTKLR